MHTSSYAYISSSLYLLICGSIYVHIWYRPIKDFHRTWLATANGQRVGFERVLLGSAPIKSINIPLFHQRYRHLVVRWPGLIYLDSFGIFREHKVIHHRPSIICFMVSSVGWFISVDFYCLAFQTLFSGAQTKWKIYSTWFLFDFSPPTATSRPTAAWFSSFF